MVTLIDGTKVEYQDYLRSDHWLEFRRQAIQRAGGKCLLCGHRPRQFGHNLHVHHNDYSRLGGERENDVCVLCTRCHDKFHGKGDGRGLRIRSTRPVKPLATTKVQCDKCGRLMVLQKWKTCYVLVCSGWPRCSFKTWMNPTTWEELGVEKPSEA